MKKIENHIVTDEEIFEFNTLRKKLQTRNLTWDVMLSYLTELGYPKDMSLLKSLSSGVNPPIIKIKHGVYTMNIKPVYKERLQTVWDLHLQKKEAKRAAKKKSIANAGQEEIAKAISLLKANGYKVQVKVMKYVYEDV